MVNILSLPLALLTLQLAASGTMAGAVIPLTESCTKGVHFEGTPKGMIEYLYWALFNPCPLPLGVMKIINGVPTYVAKAKHAHNPTRALLFLTGRMFTP